MKEIRQLVFQWARSYPGLWLSPIGLLLLGGWMWLQPSSTIQPAMSEEAGQELAVAQNEAEPENSEGTATPDSAPETASEVENPANSSSILITHADDFQPTATWDYQERPPQKQPVEEEVYGESDPALSQSKPTETIASAAAPESTHSVPVSAQATTASAASNSAASTANGTGKTDAELVADTDAIAASTPQSGLQDGPQAGPSAAEVAAAKAEQESLQQQLAAASAAQQAAPVAGGPAPNVVNGGNPAVDQAIVMQVAIAEGDVNLSMGVSDGGVLFVPNGQALAQLTAGNHSMACDGQNLILNGEQSLPSTVMMAPIQGGVNYVRDRSYRGHIQFFCQGDTVLAVNHIDMLHYLYSVVGSEVSASWPLAALKAQSVAARSYALTYYFRPAKEHFHIGDSESYQVYKGTQSEDPRVMNAVHETAGEFISYGGGIVESLYAASDDIVMEAFDGGGMSQLGALDLSEQGYNYLQILGYYYPETSLGRLALEAGE